MHIKAVFILAAMVMTSQAKAAPLFPVSYDMPNGDTGSYEYWDEFYTGAGCTTCNLAPLSGGLGELTDGVIAADNWSVTEAPVGNGPYVGWTIDPTITFHFANNVTINQVTLHLDDSDGNGGVSVPSSVDITAGGPIFNFPIADPAGPAPFAFVANLAGITTNSLSITLNSNDVWVFLSEVEFDGVSNTAAVPEPSTLLLLGTGLLGLLGYGRQRRA